MYFTRKFGYMVDSKFTACKLREGVENKVLGQMPGPEREEMVGHLEDCIMRSFVTCVLQQIL
jgi:hypothetical protein